MIILSEIQIRTVNRATLKHVLTFAVLMVLAVALTAMSARATIIQAHTAGCGGFGSCSDAAFLDFFVCLYGPVPGTCIRDIGDQKLLRSPVPSAEPSASFVQLAGEGADRAESDPVGTFDGISNRDFTAPVSAVGFGTFELSVETDGIRHFEGATLQQDRPARSASIFDYAGFDLTGGGQVTRVQLEGDIYAIQNIQFNSAAPIPEPSTLLLLASGLAGLATWRRRKAA